MYHVRVNAHPEHFLDWDKRLSEQHPHVINSLSAFGFQPNPPGQAEGYAGKTGPIVWPELTGRQIYERIHEGQKGVRAANTAKALQKIGIPGIRYLDAGSRRYDDSKSTRNYVVFDPSLVDIKRKYASGGGIPEPPRDHPPPIPKPEDTLGPERHRVHVGPIHSPVAGRTDHLPMHVPSGAYVIPADIIGAMGEGNTMAGFKVARSIFSQPFYGSKGAGEGGPYHQDAMPYAQPAVGRAAGGTTPVPAGPPVPIVAAGGEYVIHPRDVMGLGRGSLEDGHKILDEFVKRYRAKTVQVLKNLPGPKTS